MSIEGAGRSRATITNPVLRGFNPDPSMVRVGDTYYIATSTFEWFPGVRVHASQDLVHWNLVANVLDSTRLLDMVGNPASGGIWAPDLSYADGRFWLVYTDVKVVTGAFKDMTNYLTWAEDIAGPWSDPVRLNGVGFDASLFHDDGRKYLVQQTWDHREYRHPFDGITLTELDPFTFEPDVKTQRTIYPGTEAGLVEGPHLYKINGMYYLFAAEGGTNWEHQETVARSATLDALSFETMPGNPLLTNWGTPDFPLQKQGHGALVDTPSGEWYYASLVGRPWRHGDEGADAPRGWCTLGRETSIQKVEWDADGWPRVVGGRTGSVEVEAPVDAIETAVREDRSKHDDFSAAALEPHWNTLRVPFTPAMGSVGGGALRLVGRGSLANRHELSLVARRWEDFAFDAETAVRFEPTTYQAMAGLTNYYNDDHWSWVFVTWDEQRGRVIEVAENDRGRYHSYLRDEAIPVPAGVEWVHLRTKVRTSTYTYEYSFDGVVWHGTGVDLDAKVLSDDYVVQTYGGFFTGAFVGLAAVDLSGYREVAAFDHFEYAAVDAG